MKTEPRPKPVAVTHYVRWDEPGRGRVQTLCGGAFVKRTEHAEAPTCPYCQAALRALAEAQP